MQFLVLSLEKGRERVSKAGSYCCNRHVSTLIQSWLSFKQITKPELPWYTKKKIFILERMITLFKLIRKDERSILTNDDRLYFLSQDWLV